MLRALLSISTCFLFIAPAFASDHIDGPVTMQHRVGDLTDLYAFPTPQKPGFMSVILDTYPIVAASGHFSEKVVYNIILRTASLKTDTIGFNTANEVTITCSFKTPDNLQNHIILCKSTNGLSATNTWGVIAPQKPEEAFRVFFGMRADPFFFNAQWATDASKGILSAPKNSDTMANINVLTMVLDIDMSKMLKQPDSLYAIAAEALTRDTPTSPWRRLDRVGRPEITNVTMVAHPGDNDVRDLFNVDRPFGVNPVNFVTYKNRIQKNILFYDNLDKKKDWVDADKVATLLADDFLVVDIAKPCNTPTFLEIEKSMLKNRPYTTCGGRKPNDDIMDTVFTLYIAGIDGARVRDGVDQPTTPVSAVFPYLAEPDLSLWGRTKAAIARQLLGVPN
jgi:hypothetical protein